MKLNKYQRMEVLATPAAYRIMLDTVRINRDLAMYVGCKGEDLLTFAGRLTGACLEHYQADGYLIFVAGPLVCKLCGMSAALDGTTTFNQIRIRLQHEAGQDLDQEDYCYCGSLSGYWEEWA